MASGRRANRVGMSRVEPKSASRRLRAGVATLLIAAGCAALCADFARAQEVGGLRGELTEAEVNDSLLPLRRRTEDDVARTTGTTPANAATPDSGTTTTYDPVSPGALTKAEEDQRKASDSSDSIFSDDQAKPENPFADAEDIPTPLRKPAKAAGQSDADQRATDATRRSRKGPQTAAERRKAKTGDDQTDDTSTGTVRQGSVDSLEKDDLSRETRAEREEPIEGLTPHKDDTPYAALGVRAGSFILRPSLEQGITATTNGDNSAGGSDAVLSETRLQLNGVSDWDMNLASFDAYGVFRKSLSGQEIKEIEGGIDGALEYELARDYRVKATLGYAFEPEAASSPDAIAGVVTQPIKHTIDGSLGLSKDLGQLRLGVTGKVEREMYGDADLDDGTKLDQSDRDFTYGGVALRAGYEISPSIRPFVEVEAGRRIFDNRVDAGGFERSGDRLAARGGVEFDRGEKLGGEFSAGWLRESFDDDDLETIAGVDLNANLRWSPVRGTNVGLTGQTTVDTASTGDSSGSLLYSGRLTAEREVWSNLTVNGMLGLDWRDYSDSGDHDRTLMAELGATWWLNRYLGLTTRYHYETMRSTLPDRNYETNSVFAGLKMQR